MVNLTIFLVTLLSLMLLDHSTAAPEGVDGSPKKEPSANDDLFTRVATAREENDNKITIVGTGKVGTAVAFSLITQYVADEIVLIGREESKDKLEGEVEDLLHGSMFVRGPKITGGTDYALSKNSKVCIVTSGVPREPGESRLNLLKKNLAIFGDIIPKLLNHNPDAVIIIVSNPVDVMTYVAWKIANKIKPEEKNTFKIIGSGTNLDTSRLRHLVSKELLISPESVNGFVIGEHGDSSVTAWSGVNVGGVNLKTTHHRLSQELNNADWMAQIHTQMKKSGENVIKKKGYTSWAVGLSVANLAYSIIHNTHKIHAVSTMVKEQHEIDFEVFLSLPCVLGSNGVTHIIKQRLEADELESLKKSAKTIRHYITEFEEPLNTLLNKL